MEMSCCKEFENLIWEAAVNGSMPPKLRRHLGECEACRASFDALSAAAIGLATLREVQCPDPRQAVYARLVRPQRRLRPVLAFAGALVACCVIALLLFTERAPTPTRSREAAQTPNSPTERMAIQRPRDRPDELRGAPGSTKPHGGKAIARRLKLPRGKTIPPTPAEQERYQFHEVIVYRDIDEDIQPTGAPRFDVADIPRNGNGYAQARLRGEGYIPGGGDLTIREGHPFEEP